MDSELDEQSSRRVPVVSSVAFVLVVVSVVGNAMFRSEVCGYADPTGPLATYCTATAAMTLLGGAGAFIATAVGMWKREWPWPFWTLLLALGNVGGCIAWM